MSWCRVAAHNQSLRAKFGWFTPQNQHQARTTWWSSQEELGVEATPSSRGLWRFTTKLSGSLVAPQSQDRRLGGRRQDPGVSISFKAGDTRRDRGACVGRTQSAAKAWPLDENIQVLAILPMRGMYLPLSCRGNVVICHHQRDFIYIALGLDGNSSIRTTT
jgi:hypothetical protein